VNREQRRHPKRNSASEQPGHAEPKDGLDDESIRPERTQDDFSVRAKNTGHKKKTADKWNQ
jgi:hypothetical protein